MDSEVKVPKQFPSATHEVIVNLETDRIATDTFDTKPRTNEVITYSRSIHSDVLAQRISKASIVISTQALLNATTLGDAPYLKCVITPTTGLNHIDVEECRRRGIKVFKTPGGSASTVAEHALSLYFAARRKTVALHRAVVELDENGHNDWGRLGSVASRMKPANGKPPNSIQNETVGILGYGPIGRNLETLCRALGMRVLIADRKIGKALNAGVNGNAPTRVPFEEVIQTATVLFIGVPLSADTTNMIDEPELSKMKPEAVVINVARGGIANEKALLTALRENRISGYATDVFETEPALPQNSPFVEEDIKDLNITLSPHVGYFSAQTMINIDLRLKDHVRNFVDGKDIDNVV